MIRQADLIKETTSERLERFEHSLSAKLDELEATFSEGADRILSDLIFIKRMLIIIFVAMLVLEALIIV
jgi:hypothetical protein